MGTTDSLEGRGGLGQRLDELATVGRADGVERLEAGRLEAGRQGDWEAAAAIQVRWREQQSREDEGGLKEEEAGDQGISTPVLAPSCIEDYCPA